MKRSSYIAGMLLVSMNLSGTVYAAGDIYHTTDGG